MTSYGHQVGDDCLKALAQSILACIERASDLVARYGGEEFVALYPIRHMKTRWIWLSESAT